MTCREWINAHGTCIAMSQQEYKIGEIIPEIYDCDDTLDFNTASDIINHPFVVISEATKAEFIAQYIAAGGQLPLDLGDRKFYFYRVTTD